MSTLPARARRFYAEHRKAFTAAASAGLTTFVAAIADGHVTGTEGWGILAAVLLPFGVVFTVPNKRRLSPHPHD